MVLSALALDKTINGALFDINFNRDLIKVNELLSKALSKNTQYDKQLIANILQALVVDDSDFKRLMAGLNPI